jgi:DNA repair exonuclease SbcCD ATPase subunit
MIEFKEIRYKNFLSSGNQFTKIKLNQNTNTLIVGQNGAGKSTILDALCFSLFNKPFRKINKNQIVNSTNEKDCVVEIDFNVNRNEYKVIRGIKPGIFEIYQNGKKLHEDASAQDQQKTLEQSILKLNYKSFTQIVILGSASFVPFMQLPAAHRREVIEDLLDIKVFSSMSEILKNKIKDSKETVKTLELKKESIADKIVMQQNFIKQIEETGQNDIKNKQTQIFEFEKEVAKYNQSVSNLLHEVESKQQEIEKYSDASDTLRKLGTFKGKIGNKKQNSNEELEFFKENSVCPTCTQTIEETFRVNKIEELQQVLSSYESNLQEIEDTIKKEEEREQAFFGFQKEITKLQNEISQINIRISNSNKSKSTLEKEIQTITTRLENRNIEHEKLSDYKSNLRQILSDLEQLKEDYNYYLQANVLLKDDGVKSSIIKKYLPLINQQVNKYLQMMDFFINFTLDEEFNEKIQTPIHENFSYPSFSEGEKMRIDLSLLFTWREIARLKNSISTNLLIMDEVFDSSLDGLGTDEFFKIIRYMVSDANIFIISHKNELHEKFENVLEFHKVKGFSQLKT